MLDIPSTTRGFGPVTGKSAASQRVALISGVLASVLYVLADQVSANRYPGYDMVDQVISELSAIGAPTTALWSALMVVYEILIIAFTIGVFRASRGNRLLRVSGVWLLVFALSGPVWAVVPMHQRGAPVTWQDAGHLVMGGVTVVLCLLCVWFGGFALGPLFRRYSHITVGILLVTGVTTFAFASRVAEALPTPWLGVIERINVYGYLLWIAVLAVALIRRMAISTWSIPRTHSARVSHAEQ